MIFKKILITLLAVGASVSGAIQLRSVAMPSLHGFCGDWG